MTTWFTAVQPVVIGLLVLVEVAVFQLRVALATKGRKRGAALCGAVNAVVSVTALGQVLTSLDRPANVVGYAIGVAIGVYLGATADERLAGDPVEFRVVVPGDGADLVADLRARGWPVTAQVADGLRGPAALLFVAVDAARAADVARDLDELAPGVFRTSNRLRSAAAAPLPHGYLGVGAGLRRTGVVGSGRVRVPRRLAGVRRAAPTHTRRNASTRSTMRDPGLVATRDAGARPASAAATSGPIRAATMASSSSAAESWVRRRASASIPERATRGQQRVERGAECVARRAFDRLLPREIGAEHPRCT